MSNLVNNEAVKSINIIYVHCLFFPNVFSYLFIQRFEWEIEVDTELFGKIQTQAKYVFTCLGPKNEYGSQLLEV